MNSNRQAPSVAYLIEFQIPGHRVDLVRLIWSDGETGLRWDTRKFCMPRIGDDMHNQSGLLGFLCDLQKFGLTVHTNVNLSPSRRQPLLDGVILFPTLRVTQAMDQKT